ncbi:MAG: ABC-F family ATP-binding cassette domain-containing protein, partial [Firmicutes bacterium]|nr:ABC-F family ATP-binding cassette domain-containing protein [Candidatus Fermentithermobacillaceae bacterium]
AENVSKKTGRTVSDARNILGYLGISGEKQILPLSSLSMGERSRVALACLTFAPYDLLLLDEPTNHLDLIAREGVEEALYSFPGAVIVSTHDRFLANRLSSSIWYLENNTLETYKGTYKEFHTWRVSRDKVDDKEQEYMYDRTAQDLKAQELAVRFKIAEIVSKLAQASDPLEKSALEKEYQEAIRELHAVTKS